MLVAHYGELFTKGQNRPFFQLQLKRNIEAAVPGAPVFLDQHRFIVEADASAIPALQQVFGLTSVSEAKESGREMDEIADTAAAMAQSMPQPLKIEVNRSDKTYPLTSPQIVQKLAPLLEKKGVQLAVKDAQGVLRVDILHKQALIYGPRHDGLGGLPVGVSGKVVTLLSGGIDSPVAAWLLAKRGVTNTYLHFHQYASGAQEKTEKIQRLVRQLKPYTRAGTLYLVPYNEFVLGALDAPERLSLPLFRRFMMRLATAIAEKEGALGIGTGENLAQVSSQTLSNMGSIEAATTLPVLRPLLTYDKRETIALAEKIGTYAISNEAYTDCCQSLVPKHPATSTTVAELEAAEKQIPDGLVEKTLSQAVRLRL